jgi:signal transduction histidine kinase
MQRQSKILIVDDNPTNVLILEEILGNAYQLQTATCGEDALVLAQDFKPDLVLLDIMMPGLDGYETCRLLRKKRTLRHTKIVMVSAKSMLKERLHGYDVGADDYITKPFEQEELLAKVRVYLRLKSVEEVDQLKSDMLALLSHETRTPLNGILLPVQMIRDDETMEPAMRNEFLDMIYESAEKLLHLFERISLLSKMKTGQWTFEYTPGDLCDVVQHALSTVSAQAAERDITFTSDLLTSAPARLDTELMHIVVTALLENAIRFSMPAACVHIALACDDKTYCLTVSDSGAGIEPDKIAFLFEGLTEPDINHHTEGHGLSLAIAQQVVQAHGGTIEVDSVPGGGSTFRVRIPRALSY